jgi:hydrogenase expression/formation protein HypD
MAQDRLFRVFAIAEGRWRGLGAVAGSGFTFRRAYDGVNADALYPDYRGELGEADDRGQDLPVGCECAAVITARRLPADCVQFAQRCTPQLPVGPCMASPDGACFLHSSLGV